jgi:phosphomevalonate kinase
MPNSATFFAPGKLYVAGEYAVTMQGGKALILPVKKGIRVQITARKQSRIVNQQYPDESIKFSQLSDIQNAYIRLALEVVRQLLMLKKKPWRHFTLTIASTLFSQDGKYGLGSSGALTVAVIGALLKFYRLPSSADIIYRLAVIATIHNYQDTSFGDVACSSAGTPILYQKFNPEMLPLIKTMSVEKLMAIDWKGLIIQTIPPLKIKPLVVFSGKSSSSYQMVKAVKRSVTASWVNQSNALLQSFQEGNTMTAIPQLNQHLAWLEKQSGVTLFTPGIQTILKVAESYGGVAKFSGAGGGDSVIVFLPYKQQSRFIKAIQKAKFTLLRDII